MIGHYLGVSRGTDAFFVALIIPFLVGSLFASAATTALIPFASKGKDYQPGVVPALALALALASAVLSVAAVTFPDHLITMLGRGLSPDVAATASRHLRILAPLIPLLTSAGIGTAVCNARARFLSPAVATCMLYVGAIGGALSAPVFGVDALAWGILAGGAVQLAVVALAVDGSLFEAPSYHRNKVRAFAKKFGLVLSCAGITVGYLAIDRVSATSLPDGYVTVYQFATTLITLPSQIVVLSIATVVYPALVRLRDQQPRFRLVFSGALVWASLLASSALVALFFWSDEFVTLLYRSDAFDSAAVRSTSEVVKSYSVAAAAIALKDLAAVALTALGRELSVATIGAASLVLSIALKRQLMPVFGHLAIGYTTGAAALCACGLMLMSLYGVLSPRTEGTSR